jgi:hypothetical protein
VGWEVIVPYLVTAWRSTGAARATRATSEFRTTVAAAEAGAATPVIVSLWGRCKSLLRGQACEHRSTGQVESAHSVNFYHHDRYFIAYLDGILNPLHWLLCQLAETHQAIFAWENLYEGTKVGATDDFALEDLTDFSFLGQAFNLAASLLQ